MSECFYVAACSFRIPYDVMLSVFFFFLLPYVSNLSLRAKTHLFCQLSLYLLYTGSPFFRLYSRLEL